MASKAAQEQAGQAGEKAGRAAGEQARHMKAQGAWQRLKRNGPGPLGWAGITAAAATAAGVSAVGLLLVSPVLLLLSPVLVPLAVVAFTCAAAAATAGGAGVAAVSAAAWLYRYLKGQHPRGSAKADRLLGRAHDTAHHLKHKAHDAAAAAHLPTVA